jgi:IstB-like ATP binding protein
MTKNQVDTTLEKQLDYLKLVYCKENFRSLAAEGNAQRWTHLDYLQRLVEGEVAARQDRTILRRIKAARFPVSTCSSKLSANATNVVLSSSPLTRPLNNGPLSSMAIAPSPRQFSIACFMLPVGSAEEVTTRCAQADRLCQYVAVPSLLPALSLRRLASTTSSSVADADAFSTSVQLFVFDPRVSREPYSAHPAAIVVLQQQTALFESPRPNRSERALNG